MARIRSIKPEFWSSPSTAKASPLARLTYIAMWNWADDFGRGTANLKELEGFVFPHDDVSALSHGTSVNFRAVIAEVAACYGVVFYEVKSRSYYAIPAWDEHQRNERRAQSKYPAPPAISAGQTPNAEVPALIGGTSVQSDGSSGPGTGEQGNRGTGEQGTSSASTDVEREFDEFWTAYPRKKAKPDGVKAYKAARKHTDHATIMECLTRDKRTTWAKRSTEHVPYPASWLRDDPWDDEPENVHPLKPNANPLGPWPENGTAAEKDAWAKAQPPARTGWEQTR